ncbi:MAG: D-alanyl-D-alanine carboxypeptidase family protein [Candidatus Yonathbacteria bacterium]|nr:D-alanyl-D-alanine carboxypeptidase family protein [Candidatus Yonathbacteria bacterium]
MIPSTYINAIPVKENGDPLVEVTSSEKIVVFCPDESRVLMRSVVLGKLNYASKILPDGLKLKILYGYRSLRVQEKFWEETCAEIKHKDPQLSEQEIEAHARQYSALPTGNGPHQTGGAIDVLIVDKDDNSLDFGSKYRSHGDSVAMHSKTATLTQRQNRKFLREVMFSVGFTYYPGEWWHFSFGDRMWAAYTGNKFALYGPAKK